MGMFDDIWNDPGSRASLQGLLQGISQAALQPGANFGSILSAGGAGSMASAQNYQQMQDRSMDLQTKQLGITNDKFGMQQKLGGVNFMRQLQGQAPLTLDDVMKGNFGAGGAAQAPMSPPPVAPSIDPGFSANLGQSGIDPSFSRPSPPGSSIDPGFNRSPMGVPQPAQAAAPPLPQMAPQPQQAALAPPQAAPAPIPAPQPQPANSVVPPDLMENPIFQAAVQSGDQATVMSMLTKHQVQLTPEELKTARLPPDTVAFKAPDGTVDVKRMGTIQSPEEIASSVAEAQAKGLKSPAEIQQELQIERQKAGIQPPSVERNITLPILQKLQRGEQLTSGEQAVLQATKPNAGGAYDQQADFSQPLANTAYEAVAHSVANYDRSEATALSRYPAPIRAQIQARVSAINPSYQQTNYNEANATKLAFAKGPQGQSVQSLNSTISHMDLMKQYVTALNNGDIQTVNALKNAVKTEFGGTAPTNAMAVAEILGPEMAKAVLPNGGTGPEREGFVDTLKTKASQGQLVGVLDTYQGLMSGQLLSLKKRYENIPGQPKDFESKFLLPETQQILANRPEYHGGITGGPAVAAPPASNPSQRAMLPRPKTPADAQALKPGTHFLDPQDNERIR